MDLATTLFSALFPIITPSLSPGDVALSRMPLAITSPICIVGDDARSMRWLRARSTRLLKVDAVCFAVNVKNERRWRVLLEAAAGVPLSPVPGDTFATQFGLTHYPVVITTQGMGQ